MWWQSTMIGLRSSKALPQAKLVPKKRSWSLFGGLLPIWSTTTFWILTKPLPLRNVLTNRWDVPKIAVPEAGIVNRKCPILHDNAQLQVAQLTFQKLTELAMKFWLIRHRHLTSHWLPLLHASQQLFVGKMLSQPAGCRKYISRACGIVKHQFLCFRI